MIDNKYLLILVIFGPILILTFSFSFLLSNKVKNDSKLSIIGMTIPGILFFLIFVVVGIHLHNKYFIGFSLLVILMYYFVYRLECKTLYKDTNESLLKKIDKKNKKWK